MRFPLSRDSRVVAGLSAVAVPLGACLLAWVATNSWRPLVTSPGHYLWPLLVVALLVALCGTTLRSLRVPPIGAAVGQLLLGLWALHVHVTGHLLPTNGSVTTMARLTRDGAVAINRYTAPVSDRFPGTACFLAVCGLLVVVAVDLCVALRRTPLVTLPLLLTVTVPISVLVDRLAWWIVVVAAGLLCWLLAIEERRRLDGWGRSTRSRGRPPWRLPVAIGATTVVGAMTLPLLVPVSGGGFFDTHGHGPGNGTNGLTLVNPVLDLRRDLLTRTHTPLLYARTDSDDRKYVRLTVLDQFTGTQWKPSPRNLPLRNKADGPLPPAPGMVAGVTGRRSDWNLQLGATFSTTWLPLPYAPTRVTVPGDWRYDTRTLDVVAVERDRPTPGMAYTAQVFHPRFTSTALAAATSPPGKVLGPMVDLPGRIPEEFVRVTQEVTRGATTPYEKLVALQRWFTSDGGFRYTLRAAPGSGMDLLTRFVTTEKAGYCEQFAAAMAVMGRVLNIPSRVVVGFLEPDRQQGDQFVYTSDELHAWPEFYFAGFGWVGFEPTPSARIGATPPSYTVPGRTRPTPEESVTTAPDAQPQTAAPLPTRPDATTTTKQQPHTTWWPWLLAVVGLVVLLLTPRTLRGVVRRRRLDPSQSPEALAAGAWAELRATAVDHRIGWPDHRSPRETLAKVRARVSADVDLVRRLDAFTTHVERTRYAPAGTPPLWSSDEVVATVRDWSTAMAAASGDRTRSQAHWWPRSLVDRVEEVDSGDPELAHR